MITTEIFSDSSIEDGINLIKKNKLHHLSGSGILRRIKEGCQVLKVCIAFFNKQAVGCGVIINSDINLHIYVKKEYRRIGIGTKIYKTLEPEKILNNIYVDNYGYKKKFWNNFG